MIENLGDMGYGQRVESAEAEQLWETWAGYFRTNAFRRVRALQWVPRPSGDGTVGGGVEGFTSHPSSRCWVVICVWKGQPECFVHRPASGTVHRMWAGLRDAAWKEPRMFVAETTESGEIWIEDVADRRIGDWARRRQWCEDWVARMASDAGWRVKPWCTTSSQLLLLDSPLDGNRVVPAARSRGGGLRDVVETVWKPQEDCKVGVVQTPEGTWMMPRFPDWTVYRRACAMDSVAEASCRCQWNERLRCWDLVAFVVQ